MNTLRKRVTVPLAIVVALMAGPALAGCSMLEGIIESQTGGEVDLGGAGLPDGFPSADVPLIDGDIIFGVGLGGEEGKVWNVTVKVSGLDAYDTIKGQFEAAGYSVQDNGGEGTDAVGGAFTSDKYGVLVGVASDQDNGFVANYTVTETTTTP